MLARVKRGLKELDSYDVSQDKQDHKGRGKAKVDSLIRRIGSHIEI